MSTLILSSPQINSNIKTFVLGEPCKWNISQEAKAIIELLSKEFNIYNAIGEIICSYLSCFSRYGCALPKISDVLQKVFLKNLGQVINCSLYHLLIPTVCNESKSAYKTVHTNTSWVDTTGDYCMYSDNIINYRLNKVDHPQFGTYVSERGYILNGVETKFQEGDIYPYTCVVNFGFINDINNNIPPFKYASWRNVYIIGSTTSGQFIWVHTIGWDEPKSVHSSLFSTTQAEREFLQQFLNGDKWLVLDV